MREQAEGFQENRSLLQLSLRGDKVIKSYKRKAVSSPGLPNVTSLWKVTCSRFTMSRRRAEFFGPLNSLSHDTDS